MKKYIVLPVLLMSIAKCLAQSQLINNSGPPDFFKLSYEEANKAVESENTLINAEKIKKIGPEYIADLVAQLQSGKLSSENETLAIYFLGVLCPDDANSIGFLIQNINFKATRFDPIDKSRTQVERWGKYPAVDALIRIDKPAVNPILDALPQENDSLRRSLFCDVLKKILRHYTASTK